MSEVDTFLVRERDRFEEFGSDNEFTTTVDVEVPEKILKWRQDQENRLKEKDLAEEKAKEDLRRQADQELADWSKRHEDFIEKTKLTNRNAEKENIAMDTDMESGTEWERIAKLCDFSQSTKAAKSLKDNSRMRLIILQLKQNPLEKA